MKKGEDWSRTEYLEKIASMMEGCRENDQRAWEMLTNIIKKYIRTSTSNLPEDLINDMTQDILLRLIKGDKVNEIKEPGKFLAYCKRAARNRVIDYVRWKKRRASWHKTQNQDHDMPDPMDMISDDSKEPERIYKCFKLMAAVEDSLEGWNKSRVEREKKCSTILDLYFRYKNGDEDISSYNDIAEAADRNPNAIGTDIRRCFKRFMNIPEVYLALEELMVYL